MIEITLLLLVVAAVAAMLLLQLRPKKQEPDGAMLMLQQQVDSLRSQLHDTLDNNAKLFQKTMESLQSQVTGGLQNQSEVMRKTNSNLNDRLDNAAKVIGDVHRKLGEVSSTMQAVADIKDILKAPKLRGGFGEFFLGDLLGQIFPGKQYALQYEFKNREKVDAVVYLGEKMVPIDSKFPFENFQKAVGSQDESAVRLAKSQFLRDVRKHIDAVAKYIRPDEGTYDFALMYIPAEAVYYEVAVRNEIENSDKSILKEAIDKRVIPVSPNTLYSYLFTIVMGLRGLQVEKQAQYVLNQLGRLQNDFTAFADTLRILGKHIDNVRNTYEKVDKNANQLQEKLLQVVPSTPLENDTQPESIAAISAIESTTQPN